MHRRRLFVLLALSLFLLIVSEFDPISLRHSVSRTFAEFAYAWTGRIYMPLIMRSEPPPPAATTSRYVTVTDPQMLNQEGCSQGQAGRSGIVVLLFGDPSYNSAVGRYGARLPSVGTFVSTDDIWTLVSEFANGYYLCSPADAHISLAVGVTNNGSYVDRANGIAWGQLVANIRQTINYPPSMADKITAAGAVNAELQWNTPTNTRAWVDGYTSGVANYGFLYNVGNCPGCDYPTGQPSSPWDWNEVWYISFGAPLNLPLPMIYGKSGTHAMQWHSMSVYAFEQHGGYMMRFKGAFTQYDACHDSGNPQGQACIDNALDNTPADGWTQLYYVQNSDTRTAQDIAWSTDVTWKK